MRTAARCWRGESPRSARPLNLAPQGGLGVVKNGITAAAKALGMTPRLGKLRTGGSLKDVADKGCV
jgi:hypothetical protein